MLMESTQLLVRCCKDVCVIGYLVCEVDLNCNNGFISDILFERLLVIVIWTCLKASELWTRTQFLCISGL